MKDPKKGNRYSFPIVERCMQCNNQNPTNKSFCSPKCRVKYRYKIYHYMDARSISFWEAVDLIEAKKLSRIIQEETGGRIYRSHRGLPYTIGFEGSTRISSRRSKARQNQHQAS